MAAGVAGRAPRLPGADGRARRPAADDFDVVHNHSLHHLPIAMAPDAARPDGEHAAHARRRRGWSRRSRRGGRRRATFAAVSAHTAAAWRAGASRDVGVVHNGVDVDRWSPRPGRRAGRVVGRIVPEKGTAPGDAGRAGRRARRCGSPARSPTARYFEREIARGLAARGRARSGTSPRPSSRAVGEASVALVTPCWDEPYGLVVAEALACGTPVWPSPAARCPELLDPPRAAGWSPPATSRRWPAALARGALLARGRAGTRARAPARSRRMVDRTRQLYDSLAAPAGTRGGLVIGWYVHHQGAGSPAPRRPPSPRSCDVPVTGSVVPAAPRRLARRVGPARRTTRPARSRTSRPAARCTGRRCGHAGLRERMAAIAAWVDAGPAAPVGRRRLGRGHRAGLRLMGVPVVVAAMPGRPHRRAAHRPATTSPTRLIAPWPPDRAGPSRAAPPGATETVHVGAISRFDGRPPRRPRPRRRPGRGAVPGSGRQRGDRGSTSPPRAPPPPGWTWTRARRPGARWVRRPVAGAVRRRRGRHPRRAERARRGRRRPPSRPSSCRRTGPSTSSAATADALRAAGPRRRCCPRWPAATRGRGCSSRPGPHGRRRLGALVPGRTPRAAAAAADPRRGGRARADGRDHRRRRPARPPRPAADRGWRGGTRPADAPRRRRRWATRQVRAVRRARRRRRSSSTSHAGDRAAARAPPATPVRGARWPAGAELLVLPRRRLHPRPGPARPLRGGGRATVRWLLVRPGAYLPRPPDGYDPATGLHALAEPHPARPVPADGEVLDGRRPRLFWSLSFAVTRGRPGTGSGGSARTTSATAARTPTSAQTAHAARASAAALGRRRVAYHQHHPVSGPPVAAPRRHPAQRRGLRRRWGWWPMQGWLEAFAREGLARVDATTGRWVVA